jgi:hypothetical protein
VYTPELDKIRLEIRKMTRKSGLFRVLKEELGALGYWKNRNRGISADKMKEIGSEKGF